MQPREVQLRFMLGTGMRPLAREGTHQSAERAQQALSCHARRATGGAPVNNGDPPGVRRAPKRTRGAKTRAGRAPVLTGAEALVTTRRRRTRTARS